MKKYEQQSSVERHKSQDVDTASETRTGLRILVAEDLVFNQKLMTALLSKRGHSVVTAENGERLLELLERQAYDLILMDVQMPVMDGFQTTARIRAKEKKTGVHIPIIALTAHVTDGDRERFLEAGMDGYLGKPINPGELDQAIQSLFRLESVRNTEAGIRLEALEEILESGGAALLEELIGMFSKMVPEDIIELREALQKGEYITIARSAHRMISMTGNLGANRMQEIAGQIENLAKKERGDKIESLIHKLESEYQDAKRSLGEYIAGVKEG